VDAADAVDEVALVANGDHNDFFSGPG